MGTESSIQELIWGWGGMGVHLNSLQIYKGTRGKAGVLGSEQGWLSTLAGPTAPSRGRAWSEQMVVSARSCDPTQFLGPFGSFPPAHPPGFGWNDYSAEVS